jgi:hypothetical protein
MQTNEKDFVTDGDSFDRQIIDLKLLFDTKTQNQNIDG